MIILCSAIEDEMEELSEHYDSDRFIKVNLGVGLINAAANLKAVLAEHGDEIEEVVFMGTAGSYRKNLKIGDVVQVQKAHLHTLGKLLDVAYTPTKVKPINLTTITSEKMITADCMSAMEITNDDITAAKIYKNAGKEFLVENMELFAVAQIAEEHELRCRGILAVTNYCNIFADKEYEDNEDEVHGALCEFVDEMQL